MNSELRKLNRKIDKLQRLLNHQNESIMDQSLIIHKLIEKLTYNGLGYPFPKHIEEDFKKDNWQPYKGPDCENRTTTPIYSTAYDGTKTILPVNTLPDREWYG